MGKKEKITYRVIFDGSLAAGKKLPEVKGALLQSLGCKPEDINPMFIGRPVVIGQDLPEKTANRLVAVLKKAGLVVHKETNVDTAEVKMEALPKHQQEFINISPAESMAHGKHYCEIEYLSFSGRLGRVRFMGWFMGALLLGVPITASGLWLTAELHGAGAVFAVLVIPLLAFLVSVIARRLHDIDLPGGWALAYLIVPPLLGYYVFPALGILTHLLATLLLSAKGGTESENNFDFPPPPDDGKIEVLLACAFPLIYLVTLFYVGTTLPKWITSMR